MTYQAIRSETRDGVATVTLNRPDVHNAMNETMRRELTHVFDALATSEDVRCVVVTGAGEKAFSAGADIREFVETGSPTQFRESRKRLDFRQAMDRCWQPIIAAIRGHCFGGGLELALACDIRIASEDSRLGLTEVDLAIIPGFGGTQRLVKRVGLARARELIYLGQPIHAEDALRIGLVARVAVPERLVAEAQDLAEELAGKPPLALRQAKLATAVAADADITTGCRYEIEAFAVTFASEDRVEGLRAFQDKRTPAWKGR